MRDAHAAQPRVVRPLGARAPGGGDIRQQQMTAALGRLPLALALVLAAARGRAATPPEAAAVPLPEPPALDGEVLGDAAWANVPALDSFWQLTPDEGQPASERTEVRIGVHPGHALHRRRLPRPRAGRIIVADSRRDSPLDETDSFQIILDTFRDGQNGFVFGTNPAGIEYDGQVTNEGREADLGPGLQTGDRERLQHELGRLLAGAHAGWPSSAGARSSRFRSGRCATGSGGAQVWGLNFQRNIRRRNETSFWAPLPAAVQPLSALARRQPARPGGAAPAQPEDHALRARRDQP